MDINNKQKSSTIIPEKYTIKQEYSFGIKVHYLELVFIQPILYSTDSSKTNYVYYKKGKDWVYTKIDTPNVSFSIQLDELQDIQTIISQFRSLNPTFILSTVKYI